MHILQNECLIIGDVTRLEFVRSFVPRQLVMPVLKSRDNCLTTHTVLCYFIDGSVGPNSRVGSSQIQ